MTRVGGFAAAVCAVVLVTALETRAGPIIRVEVGTDDGSRDPGDFEVVAAEIDDETIVDLRESLAETPEAVVHAKLVVEGDGEDVEAMGAVARQVASGHVIDQSTAALPKLPPAGGQARTERHRRVMTLLRFFGVGTGVFLSLHEGRGADLSTAISTAVIFGSMSAALQFKNAWYQEKFLNGFLMTHALTQRGLDWAGERVAAMAPLKRGVDALKSLFGKARQYTEMADILRNWWITETLFLGAFKLALLAHGALGDPSLMPITEWIAGGLAAALHSQGLLDSDLARHLVSVAEGATVAMFAQGFLDSANAKFTQWRLERLSSDMPETVVAKRLGVQYRSDALTLAISAVSNALVVASILGVPVGKIGVYAMGATGLAAYTAAAWVTRSRRDSKQQQRCEELFSEGTRSRPDVTSRVVGRDPRFLDEWWLAGAAC